MNPTTIRSALPRLIAILAAGTALVGLSACGGSDVTRARLERNLPQTFSNLYVQQAAILGHTGITVASITAKASCDKGGPKVADVGPGANWICMISFNDQNHAKQTGKFELQVKADSTYVAGGPSKLIGVATITDKTGKDVPDPVFEFDGAFDPNS